MKPFFRAILVCLLPLAVLRAQEPPTAGEEMPAYQQEFLNLPEEQREEFQKTAMEAQRLFGQKRIFEALEMIAEAKEIFANSPDLLNLAGACQVEFRNFDKAMEHFERANELIPNQQNILFNLAEVSFVTKDWPTAESRLSGLLEVTPPDPSGAQLQMARLIEFKLMLVKIKLDKMDEAKQLAGKYDYLDDSPFPYFAEAALHFAEGDEVKAEAAMARGNRIFQNPAILSPWQDTMIEFGYIKSFFGGEPELPALPVE